MKMFTSSICTSPKFVLTNNTNYTVCCPYSSRSSTCYNYYTCCYGYCNNQANIRRLLVTSRPTGKGQRVDVTGGDTEGHPFSYLKQVPSLESCDVM